MQFGMIELGWMGSDIARRLVKKEHTCVVDDIDAAAVSVLERDSATGTACLANFAVSLSKPRIMWFMLPAATIDQELAESVPLLKRGDIIIDGGNSSHRDGIRRGTDLKQRDIRFVDAGNSAYSPL